MSDSVKRAAQKITAVIVSGGSSGIGREFIEQLSKLKGDLWICNLSRRKPEDFSENPRFRHIGCDLTHPNELSAAAGELRTWLEMQVGPGNILLINNSGFGTCGRFQELDQLRESAMIELNCRAPVALTGQLLPHLLQRGGDIINIASTAAFQPTPTLSTYGATKAFLLSWSLSLNEDLRGTGVGCLCVCPGPTTTAFFKNAGLDDAGLPGQMTVTSVVRSALEAWAAGRPLVVTGWRNRLLVMLSSLGPKSWVARMSGLVLKQARLRHRKQGGES